MRAVETGPDKAELRRRFRRRRRESLPVAAAGILAVAQRLLPPLVGPGQRLGLYWPLADEPDLRPLAAGLSGQLALPAILPGRRLVYLPWQPGQELVADGCGIPSPLPADADPAGPRCADELAPEALALLLVPALAVDHAGLRLGSGGGWFDRLRSDPAWRSVPALAVLPATCVVPRLPRDAWDVPFDGWLDETGWHRP